MYITEVRNMDKKLDYDRIERSAVSRRRVRNTVIYTLLGAHMAQSRGLYGNSIDYLFTNSAYLCIMRVYICILVRRIAWFCGWNYEEFVHPAEIVCARHNYSFFCLHFYTMLL